jgi:flavin-dependent dehydrogenase
MPVSDSLTQVTAIDACDVLVIGGGPAGSTAAALLASKGHDVVLVEKEAHPRFHIGESLLPRNLDIFDRLGLHEQIAAMAVFKPGAEFVDDDTGGAVAFSFALSPLPGARHAYQVRRDEFDALLFSEARKRGARCIERLRVTAMEPEGGDGRARVTALTEDGATQVFAPKFVLDASGRDTFLAGKLGLKESSKRNNTAAAYAHYRGVETRGTERAGYITVHLTQDGWFWTIPLPDGITSIGFVGTQAAFKERHGDMAAFLEQRLRMSPTLHARMAQAERVSEVFGTGNYSYRATAATGANHLLIGDAFAFIDPVFSSGVLFAMTGGELGAEVASRYLENPAAARAMARRAERKLRHGMDHIGWLIYRINRPVLRAMFMAPRNAFRMRDGLVAMLAGNLGSERGTRLPVLAFKATYYAMSLFERLAPRAAATALRPPEAPSPAE